MHDEPGQRPSVFDIDHGDERSAFSLRLIHQTEMSDNSRRIIGELAVRHPYGTVTVHDLGGTYLDTSRNVEAVMGWAPYALIGSNAYEWISSDTKLEVLSNHHQIMRFDELQWVTYGVRQPNGMSRVVRSVAWHDVEHDILVAFSITAPAYRPRWWHRWRNKVR